MTSAALGWTVALAIIVAAGLGAAVTAWLLRRQQRLADLLARARQRARIVEQLLIGERWETDSEHRRVAAADASEAGQAGRPTLWEALGADPERIAPLMARGAVLDDIDIGPAPAGGAPRILRGRPLVDPSGHFAGYVGTVHEATAPATAAAGAGAGAAGPGAEAPAHEAAVPDNEHESFSYTVSHDLRAPIRVVEGFTKIVKEDYGRVLDRVGHDHLDRVLGAAARMNSMIDALLALSRLSSQPVARVPVNLSQLAEYVVDDLRRQWPDRSVACEIEPGLLVVGDPTLLRMVLENLLGNAWKYTARVGASARVAFVRHDDRPATYSVRDNGAGFDMRFADRLFGVFQRLHSASEFAGTGVGLASVRRIVRRHGGEIWAEAEPDRGASFHFSLPPAGPP